jgi:hypothetical protein
MKTLSRRHLFRALLSASVALALPGVAQAKEEETQDIISPAIAYHTELLMEHHNRIARLEGLVHEPRPMPEARGAA